MTAVMDSSAVLALLNGEAGADIVARRLGGAAISAVNIAEVGSKLVDGGMTPESAARAIELLRLRVVDFDESLAIDSFALRAETKKLGLSLGDRACLAVAVSEALPALTADRSWRNLKLDCEIELIR